MNSLSNEFNQVPVVILCGGKGVMLDEKQNQRINKGLINIQNKPLFLWVVHHYALNGATSFILATGLQNEQFKTALESAGAKADTNNLNCYNLTIAQSTCHVRIVKSVPDATTAERLFACKQWLEQANLFAVTYSDTLSDVDLSEEMRFHKSQKLVATLVAAKYPIRFRVLGIRRGEVIVRAFASRPVIESVSINGGYYIFTSALWEETFGLDKPVALENQSLESLVAVGQLAAFEHNGCWQNYDAERDLIALQKIAQYLDAHTSRIY
jgi:glucose-1-phosphate cytidylyltransferase